jgi:hypothetical protein
MTFNDHRQQRISVESIYATIRQEILDQKRCQFQIFSLAVTGTALILAYAAATSGSPLVYLAPIVMNDFALIMILDKAVSVQRKVGFLQMMEQHWDDYHWMWETQLDSFRGKVPLRPRVGGDPARKHSYVTSVGMMLIGLNVLAALLATAATIARSRGILWPFSATTWTLLTVGTVLLVGGLFFLVIRRRQLISGRHSGPAIHETWLIVLRDYAVGDSAGHEHKGKREAASGKR